MGQQHRPQYLSKNDRECFITCYHSCECPSLGFSLTSYEKSIGIVEDYHEKLVTHQCSWKVLHPFKKMNDEDSKLGYYRIDIKQQLTKQKNCQLGIINVSTSHVNHECKNN